MLKMAGASIGETRRFLGSILPSDQGAFFECTEDEGEGFHVSCRSGGRAVRYRAVHRGDVEDMLVALDVALKRNDENWFETLPAEISEPILYKLYYGHFFCHVFHQDSYRA